MTIFAGADPGTANYGYTVLRVGLDPTRALVRAKPLCIGMWRSTLTNLTDKPVKLPKSKRRKRDPDARIPPFNEQMIAFVEDWEEIFFEYEGICRLTVERYQARGMMGKTIENVNMMNGALWGVCDNFSTEFECITAATWKNQVNRYTELEGFYTLGHTPHSVDSFFIALYGALKYHGRKWETVDFPYIARALQKAAVA